MDDGKLHFNVYELNSIQQLLRGDIVWMYEKGVNNTVYILTYKLCDCFTTKTTVNYVYSDALSQYIMYISTNCEPECLKQK